MTSCSPQKTTPLKATLALKTNALLGEGAFWNYKTNELYWIDIDGKQLHIYSPKENTDKSLKMPCRIGTVVPSETHNKAIVALEDGVYITDTTTEELTKFSEVETDNFNTRLNDGKCDPNGNLWVGSLDTKFTNPIAGLYKVDAKGIHTKMAGNITISNGIVWSKDTKTMYYIDTSTNAIKAYDFNVNNSTISNERIAVTIDKKHGQPDGMAIDENGMLWVGMWLGKAVAQFNPKTGELVSKIEVPALNVTSCAFGGKDLKTLYITTARVETTEEQLKEFPLAGSIFKVDMPVKGLKSNFFKTPELP